MKSEHELNLVTDKIKRDAKKRGIDLSDPTHAFTVWVESPDQMVYSGSFTTHNEAAAVAVEHTKGKLYIAMGPLSNFAVYEV
jgi:hypothetical protein